MQDLSTPAKLSAEAERLVREHDTTLQKATPAFHDLSHALQRYREADQAMTEAAALLSITVDDFGQEVEPERYPS